MTPPVTRVPGSRPDTASGSGDSGLRVLLNVVKCGVRDNLYLPEALVIREESVPGVVDLHCIIVNCHEGLVFYIIHDLHSPTHLQGGDMTIGHPGVVRPASVLDSLYRGQEGPAPAPGLGAGILSLEEHLTVMGPVTACLHL